MTNEDVNQKPSKHPLFVLFILFLVFIFPLFFAWFMYEKYNNNPKEIEKTTNYGELIQPPKDFYQLHLQNSAGTPINIQLLKGKWLMLYVNPALCEKSCEKMLYNVRQIRLATGKDMERVERIVLTFSGSPVDPNLNSLLQTTYPGTLQLMTAQQEFSILLGNNDSAKLALQQGYLYLVDPLGNIMMGYPMTANPSGILKDFERLLRVSQIG